MPLPALGDSLGIIPGMKGNLGSNVVNKGRNSGNTNNNNNNNPNLTSGRRKSSPHQSMLAANSITRNKNDGLVDNSYKSNDYKANSGSNKAHSHKSNIQTSQAKKTSL